MSSDKDSAERLIDASPEFAAGYAAAMREVWDRLPMSEYLCDGLSGRELRKLAEFVESCVPNAEQQPRREAT